MQSSSLTSIAHAFQAAGRVARALLVSDRGKPASAPGFHLPYTGWVGPKFQGGTVIVAKNPGGEGDVPPDRRVDFELDAALHAFNAAPDPVAALRRITELYLAQENIGMHRILEDVERALGERRETLAYINPCPYRTPGGLRMKACLSLVAQPLLEALRPDTIIVLNASIGQDIADLERRGRWTNPPSVRWPYTLRRNRKDSQGLSREGLALLEQAALDNAARTAHRAR